MRTYNRGPAILLFLFLPVTVALPTRVCLCLRLYVCVCVCSRAYVTFVPVEHVSFAAGGDCRGLAGLACLAQPKKDDGNVLALTHSLSGSLALAGWLASRDCRHFTPSRRAAVSFHITALLAVAALLPLLLPLPLQLLLPPERTHHVKIEIFHCSQPLPAASAIEAEAEAAAVAKWVGSGCGSGSGSGSGCDADADADSVCCTMCC